jgi:ribosome assembly protein 1
MLSLSVLVSQSTPLVRVAIEPKVATDLARVEAGLRLLNSSDPCVDVKFTDSGEVHLYVLGELHLEVRGCSV